MRGTDWRHPVIAPHKRGAFHYRFGSASECIIANALIEWEPVLAS